MSGVTRVRASSAVYDRPSGLPESSVVTVLRVPPELEGQRLDVFVHGQLHRTSRTRAQAIVRISAFDAKGKKLRANDRVRAEQHVLLWRPPWDEDPVDTPIEVLHEDPHLLAVDKPPLVPVHPTARYYRSTLIRILSDARPGQFLSLGHRIDRETSGVLLVAKSRECDRALKRLLELRDDVRKFYVAITWGRPNGVPLAPETTRYERSVELDPDSPLRVKMRLGRTSAALHAATTFSIAGVSEQEGRTYAAVRCELETGRQHQIRLHLASLGAPIVGDKLYGPDEGLFARAADGELTAEDVRLLELSRHALHASEIQLPHPITGVPLAIRAPLPADMTEFWASTRPATALDAHPTS